GQEVVLIVDDRATTPILEDALGACHGVTIVRSPLFRQRRANNRGRVAASDANSSYAAASPNYGDGAQKSYQGSFVHRQRNTCRLQTTRGPSARRPSIGSSLKVVNNGITRLAAGVDPTVTN